MNRIVIPETYRPALGGYDLQCAIGYIKHGFQAELERSLRLKRVSAPLFVSADSGLNDDLSGTERPVAFDIPAIGKEGQNGRLAARLTGYKIDIKPKSYKEEE